MFFGDFEDKADVCHKFNIEASCLKGCKILFAAYGCEYEGEALVVFRKYRKLYEVNASHCSCYGLEGQWEPEITSVEALRYRLDEGTLGYFLGNYTHEFQAMLERLSHKETPICS